MTAMPSTRRRELAHGLAASIGLLALLAGVPAVLVGIAGWPLPHQVPSWVEIQTALARRQIPDEVLLNVVAVVGWLVWTLVVVSVLTELAAAVQGRLAARLPAPFSLTQALAARLVSAALLLGSSPGVLARPAAATPDLTAPSAPVIRAAQPAGIADPGIADRTGSPDHGPDHGDGAGGRAPGRLTTTTQSRPVYVVQPRKPGRPPDTLWGIAERYLPPNAGELPGMRWREIFELNRGRLQPDGRRLQHPDWIFPGWELLLPADAKGLPPRPAPAPSRPGGVDRPPDTTAGWTPGGPLAPSTAPSTAASTTTTTPSTAQAPTTTSAVAPSAPATRPSPATPATPTPEDSEETGEAEAGWPLLVAGVGGVLAAGVAGLLARRRRRQQRHRQPNRRPRLPTGPAATMETTVTAAADQDLPRLVDLAARALAAVVGGTRPPPVVQAITVTDTAIDLHLAEPAEPVVGPFIATDDGDPRRWRLLRPASLTDLEHAAADLPNPLPALVTLGAADTGLVLVNLDAGPVTALLGTPDDTQAVLAAMAVELATAPDDRVLSLLLVGFGGELASLPRVRAVQALDQGVLERLERDAATARQLLTEVGQPSAPAARLAGVLPDSWAPTIVLCANPLPAEQLIRLAAICDRSTVTAVVADQPGGGTGRGDADTPLAGWRLVVKDGWAQLHPVGVGAQPQQLTPQQYTAIVRLLDTAADTGGVRPGSPPYDQLPAPPPPAPPSPSTPPAPAQRVAGTEAADPPAPASATDVHAVPAAAVPRAALEPAPQAGIGVEVLGPITLTGLPRPIERGKSVEFIVYLALHPHGSDADRVWEALWPGRPLKRSTLHSTVSAARVGLGTAPDGTPYVADARDGRYRLAGGVRLDWSRFQALAATGQAGQGPDADVALERALELVRGEPLDAGNKPRAYEWALVYRVEMASRIAEVAELLARRRLDAGDPAGAAAAARQGLRGAPLDERLYRVLMQAADQAGTSIEQILDELVTRLEVEDPDEELHPDTVALYRRLRRRTRPGGSVAGRLG